MSTHAGDSPSDSTIHEATPRTMSVEAIKAALGMLRDKRADMVADLRDLDDNIRACDDELRMRAMHRVGPFEALAWDAAIDGQESLFDYAATLMRAPR